ncbi:PDZ domain-containing protein [Peribacillus deserti]|uniref:endopeptidase La n=1 Tax=Peribacillus deserti TaxID=673318 RepID=A0ABS2QJB4_9BACI|nr:SepM family pheromone-processing serine protease [Peribacillus deserti]MBM7692381.1 PDZ domain-containing protein [Peribacillus deserti]
MSRKFSISSFIIVMIVILGSTFFTLPFYVTKPGMAEELDPVVHVDGGYQSKGEFMLTTIRMGKANIYTYLIAKFSKYQELYPINQIRNENETDEEYNVRQLNMMEGSKESAIEVAYKKAGQTVTSHFNGIYVMHVSDKMPASGVLEPGDRIVKLNGRTFQSSKQFIDYLSKKQSGEEISISFERDKETKNKRIKLAPLPGQKGRMGIGIHLIDDKNITTDPKVTINSDKIGGPSAGLMFSLEIYDQLTEEDITKGRKIAGTGEILPDGTVGPIGGIDQKIVAADKSGADIFFAPNEKGKKDSNYRLAVKAAKDIETNMKIVPVDTFSEALEYLDKVKGK